MSNAPTLTGTISAAAATLSGNLTLSGGTANGVLYLNGSKVATSGSALTFDGTTLGISSGGSTPALKLYGAAVSQGQLQFSSTSGYVIQGGPDYTGLVYNVGSASYQHIFQINGSEAMRLTSTSLYTASGINVGIGTSSPAYKLDVSTTSGDTQAAVYDRGSGSSAARFDLRTSGTGASQWYIQTGNTTSGLNGSLRFYDQTNNLERMRLDTSGNLGLGVTPSAWGGTYKAIDFGTSGSLTSNTGVSTFLLNNCYNNGTNWIYLTSAASVGVQLFGANPNGGGGFAWSQAASGTAGNAITFTQAMTLDASGNLGVGTTSPGAKLHIEGGTENAIIGSSQRKLYFRADSVGVMLGTGAAQTGNSVYFNQTSNLLYFQTASTERARITSGGQFVVNNTTAIVDATLSSLAQSNVSAAAFKSDASTVYAIVNIWGNESSGNQIFARFATDSNSERGSITYNRTGGLVAYNTTSDYRAKDIIGPVTDTGATIDALKVYEGKMKGATKSRPMLVAHEAQEVTPYAVTGEKDAVNDDGTPKYQQMDVSSFVPLLIAEIQSLRQRVSQLEGA